MTYEDLWKKSRDEFKLDANIINYMFKYYLNLNEQDKLENKLISRKQINSYVMKLEELLKGNPIQYVVGNVDFFGYNFCVNPSVLIPRFETEELVQYTKEYIKEYFNEDASLIDVGTGSGVIGISLKKEIPKLNVTLLDISKDALKVAKTNAKRLDVNVKICESNMLDEIIARQEKYDILISNPPYLSPNEKIMDLVKDYEPSIALYGGEDGLEYYEILLRTAKDVLNKRALIAFEIGAKQSKKITKIAKKYFKDSPYEVKKDLEGRERMFFLFIM